MRSMFFNVSFLSPNSSKAPALAKDSIDLLLRSLDWTRSKKSAKDLYGPFFRRSSIIASTIFSPTFFIEESPKRISPPRLALGEAGFLSPSGIEKNFVALVYGGRKHGNLRAFTFFY